MDDGEDSTHDQMEEYEHLAAQERKFRSEKRAALSEVGADLTQAVERAVDAAGTNVAIEAVSGDGSQHRLAATLDRPALVAAVTEQLPPGFSIKRVNDDGTLTVEWSRRENSPEQRATAILQAIVRDQIETDAEDFIVDAPTRSEVIDRAEELGVGRDLAGQRLQRMDDIGLVMIEEGKIFPDSG